jgi:dihydroorotase
MMNRRQFMSATAGFGVWTAAANGFASAVDKYELIIKNGRVVDPAVRLDAIRDVAIAGGRIAAVQANIVADAGETIDARGKIVVPGLLDIHTS